MSTATESPAAVYSEADMQTIKDSEHIRRNPGMYIGNTDANGLHHLAMEAISNSVNEVLVGYCRSIAVTLHIDGSVGVRDDGRGIPVEINPLSGKSRLEEYLTVCGTSGRLDETAYRLALGLHGVGAKVITALSEWCEVEVIRDGWLHRMGFERGVAVGAIKRLGPIPRNTTGTTVTFHPDPEIFGSATFDAERLAERLKQLAYLHPGLRLSLEIEATGKRHEFHSANGLADYVRELTRYEAPLHDVIHFQRTVDEVVIEVALQWCESDSVSTLRCFMNDELARDGGTPVNGLNRGLTRCLLRCQPSFETTPRIRQLSHEDVRDGLVAIISIRHPDPIWESAIRSRVGNPELEKMVADVVNNELGDYLALDDELRQRIWAKCDLSRQARIIVRDYRARLRAERRQAQ